MKNSKKITRIITYLDDIEEYFNYYTNGNKIFSKEFEEIRQIINDLALEKKEDRARFAKKLKYIWKQSEDSSNS